MDISMPRLNGFQATRRIKAEYPETKVIMLTVHEGMPYRSAAEESGADAYVLKKNFKPEEVSNMRKMIKSVMVPIAGLALLATTMAACGTLTGAAIGAGSGAAIGAGVDAKDPGRGAKRGALIGAGVGAAAGTLYDWR